MTEKEVEGIGEEMKIYREKLHEKSFEWFGIFLFLSGLVCAITGCIVIVRWLWGLI